MKLLVIEDSARLRRSLRAGLENVGHEVCATGDGAEGLRLARTDRPDLVLLDLGLPALDGLEVLRALRRNGDRVPVLILSARDTARQRVEGLRAGADDYLVKPFDFEEVCARIEALQRRSASGTGGSRPAEAVPGCGRERVGSVLDRRYRLLAEIGRGGFATVYRAEHVELERPVAVKVLHPGAGLLASRSARREGISANRVVHPHAVTVLDSGIAETGERYLVMELLEGESLGDELRRDGRSTRGRLAAVVPPVCRVLETAHRSGIVHRDVKPDNVFLHRPDPGREIVKVLDFGIAKWLWADGDVTTTLRQTDGVLVGTLPYLAPEQVRNEPIGGAADVYGLAVTLHRMLTGRLPFEPGTDVLRLLTAICEEAPPDLRDQRRDVPRTFTDLVTRGLAKRPEDRPSLRELAAAAGALRVESPGRVGRTRSAASQRATPLDPIGPTVALPAVASSGGRR